MREKTPDVTQAGLRGTGLSIDLETTSGTLSKLALHINLFMYNVLVLEHPALYTLWMQS